MRVLVTGSTGFVGRWLLDELRFGGHDAVGFPEPDVLDIADRAAVRAAVHAARPAAVIHLAAMAYAPDAAADAAEAIRVNVGGTLAVVEACRSLDHRPALLAISSSEVYAPPNEDISLVESSPLGPRGVYGLTKLAAEALAVVASRDDRLEVAAVRPFNHTGPGQRPAFAVPAFAQRIVEARAAGVHEIRAGNVDLARDIGDVRDVVRAYRLLVEALVDGRVPQDRRVFNVATGRAVTMRGVIDRLAVFARWPVTITRDPALVRSVDPPVIRGDSGALRELTGWEPQIDLDTTLSDVLTSLA